MLTKEFLYFLTPLIVTIPLYLLGRKTLFRRHRQAEMHRIASGKIFTLAMFLLHIALMTALFFIFESTPLSAQTPGRPASMNENKNKHHEDDSDFSTNGMVDMLLAGATGDMDAALAIETACRKHAGHSRIITGPNTTTIVRGSTRPGDTREYHCVITPAARKAVLKSPDGAEVTLTISKDFADFISALRKGLVDDEPDAGPEIVLAENPHIDLGLAAPPRVTFAQIAGHLAPALPPGEQTILQKHADDWKRFAHEHALPDTGGVMLVACDITAGRLYLKAPSLHCRVSPATRTVSISRHDYDNESGTHHELHPAPAFFETIDRLVTGETAPAAATDDLAYPDENLFKNKKRNDRKQPQFELWHDTKTINAILRGLIEKGGLLAKELDAAKRFVREIPNQSDLYCMFIRGGTLQIVCLGAKSNITQCVIISIPAGTATITGSGSGVTIPLTPAFKTHLIDVLKACKKSAWLE
ncbi:hypothetical protein M2103_000318 [Ereboglobus sp. PH5-5]|uniref:hypothetical protein n=1 Tax=Ereboglobus sp. PH5-5 TaxID=2940529 RepID=UPI002405C9D1|nr:hypothetical protein [Ereboglobus sp. PH5-5]MDF9832110.1 hypothetical protein [Ereboglobus sp. PH5-5]